MNWAFEPRSKPTFESTLVQCHWFVSSNVFGEFFLFEAAELIETTQCVFAIAERTF